MIKIDNGRLVIEQKSDEEVFSDFVDMCQVLAYKFDFAFIGKLRDEKLEKFTSLTIMTCKLLSEHIQEQIAKQELIQHYHRSQNGMGEVIKFHKKEDDK